jgi:hypothetical protein
VEHVACMGEMRNAYREDIKGGGHLEDLGVDGG